MYTINQALFVVRNRGQAFTSTIEKIGRKWLTLSTGERVGIDNLQIDGGEYNSPGRCYVSEAAYQEEKELAETWSSFRLKIYNRYIPPPNVSVEDIKEAEKLFFSKGES